MKTRKIISILMAAILWSGFAFSQENVMEQKKPSFFGRFVKQCYLNLSIPDGVGAHCKPFVSKNLGFYVGSSTNIYTYTKDLGFYYRTRRNKKLNYSFSIGVTQYSGLKKGRSEIQDLIEPVIKDFIEADQIITDENLADLAADISHTMRLYFYNAKFGFEWEKVTFSIELSLPMESLTVRSVKPAFLELSDNLAGNIGATAGEVLGQRRVVEQFTDNLEGEVVSQIKSGYSDLPWFTRAVTIDDRPVVFTFGVGLKLNRLFKKKR